MSESETEQSSPEPLSPRTAVVRAGLRRNYSSSSTESRSCESESSSKMAEIPNNNNNVDGGAALVVQPRKPLCEFSIPKVTDQPSCIVYPQLTVDRFELKSGMIHLLPTYYGNTTEDPYMHIKQFFEICATIKIQGLDDEQIKMRLFPFSLKDKAKSWLYSLPNASIHTWEELSNKFLQKFFPAQKTNKIRQEILRFTQKEGEAFHECWERYKEMISSCPHHNIETWMQMQSFYEGLLDSERMMVDATSGEGLMNKTADEAFTLFESLSANSQQWSHSKGRGAPMKAVMQTNQNLQNAVNKLEVQVGQIASSLSNRASGTFPSQTEVNPRHYEQVKAVHILRSGKQVDNKVGDENEEQEDGKNVETIQPPQGQPTASNKQPLNASGKSTGPKVSSNANQVPISTNAFRPIAPFPSRLSNSKKDQGLDEIMETFGKVQINIPLLNAIARIPKYAKFLKDLCTNKRRFKEHEQVALSEEVSAVLQRKLPPKLKDPDRTIRYPKGILEDVLVNVEGLILPADFLVLEMEEAPIPDNELPLILGRPFMATAKTKIDVEQGTLTMTVNGETVAFKVFNAPKPNVLQDCFQIEVCGNPGTERFDPYSAESCLLKRGDKEEKGAAHMFNATIPTPKKGLPKFGDIPIIPTIHYDSIPQQKRKRKAARKRWKLKTSLVNSLAVHAVPIGPKPPHSL
ncbi:unnamed protein product [Prunus brigantina]